MKLKGLLLSVIVEGVRTRKDRTLSLTLGTQEMGPSDAGSLIGLNGTLCAVYISPKELIDQKEIDAVDKLNPEFGGKTQSQRMRNILFLLFSKDSAGFSSFDTYYHAKMEGFIESLKKRIDE